MNLLITGAWSATPAELDQIRAMGHTVTFVQDERIPLAEQGIDPSAIEGVVCNGLFLTTPIEAFPNLKYIQLTSAGYDRVPMDGVNRRGIEIRNARGVYSVPMAEFALCGVLELCKQSRFFSENQKKHHWEKQRGLHELCGKTVCVVGCGSVGTACATRFGALGMKVLGVDLYPREDAAYASIAPLEELDTVLPASDVVIVTLPLTEETRHLFGAERLSLLKPTAVLVNIARGAVVDTDALIRRLPTLGGAVLDVFEQEPLGEDSPLWDAENVILTPHNSFVGEGNAARLGAVILDGLRGMTRV